MEFKETSQANKNFIRLKAGEEIVGIFRGSPHDYRTHWTGETYQKCEGNPCPICITGKKSMFRFRLNFITKEGDVYVGKIFENNWTVYGMLKSLHSDSNLEKTILKIKRSGSGPTDTNYVIIPKGMVTDELEKKIATIKLHDLTQEFSKEEDAPQRESGDEDVPF